MNLAPEHIRITRPIPGLEALNLTYTKCTTLSDLLAAIVAGHMPPPPHVAPAVTDALQPLTPTVIIDPACAPAVDYYWTIKEIAGGQQWTMRGDPTADATGEPIVIAGTYAAPHIDWTALAGPLATYLIQLTVTDSCAGIGTGIDLVTPVASLKTVIGFSGTDVPVTVPPGAGKMQVKAWGAGGGSQSNRGDYFGGASGYTEGFFAVVPGTRFTAVVGQGGLGQGGIGSAYGFSGPNSGDGGQGGGLTGLFHGDAPVLATDQARALLVAGGGGGADYAGVGRTRGGNGNDPLYSGGMPTMLGVADNTGTTEHRVSASGGGGYTGGTANPRAAIGTDVYGGNGGSGYLAPTALTGTIAHTAEPDRQPPNQTDEDYIAGIGSGGAANTLTGHAGHGHLVIIWTK